MLELKCNVKSQIRAVYAGSLFKIGQSWDNKEKYRF